MLAHAPRNTASVSRGTSHVSAVAHIPPATSLVWAHIVSAEDDAILFGHECLLVRPCPVAQRFCFAHFGVEGIRRPFTNDREDDLDDGRGITGFRFSDLYGHRLEVYVLCPQWGRLR